MPSLSTEVKGRLDSALEYIQRFPGESTRSVAKKYGLAKSTLQARLKDLERGSRVNGGQKKVLSKA